MSEVNRIPVPIQFGLPQEEKSIAGERGGFFFLKQCSLPDERSYMKGTLIACLRFRLLFLKRVISARDPPEGGGEGGLEINSDK